ncbi:predicted protein [Postia placenta Mad-698-R]|nr:predicted protein [Postia placenta Mad-698-R]
MSSTLSFLDQFNAPSTKGGKRLSIYTPKHTHVGDSTLLTLLLRCGKEAPGHLERECGTRPMKQHVSAPPEEPARRVGVVVDNVFLEGIINEAKERKEKERQTKATPIPPPHSANPEPPASPVTGPSRPRPNTPVVFRKVDPDWTPDTTQWTWDSSWPNQKHLSGEEWMNVGRNARKEWFDEEEDDSVDWELYGDGEQQPRWMGGGWGGSESECFWVPMNAGRYGSFDLLSRLEVKRQGKI